MTFDEKFFIVRSTSYIKNVPQTLCTEFLKELTDSDIRQQMYKDQQHQIEQDMAPFGFVVNGLEEENIGGAIDEYGTKWTPIVRKYDTDW